MSAPGLSAAPAYSIYVVFVFVFVCVSGTGQAGGIRFLLPAQKAPGMKLAHIRRSLGGIKGPIAKGRAEGALK